MGFIKSFFGKNDDFSKLTSIDSKYLDASMKLIAKWSEYYSDEFIENIDIMLLSKEKIDITSSVISIFCELCYVRHLEKPGQWTESTVKDACRSILPENIMDEEYLSKKIIPVLCNFMKWMSSKEYLPDTKELQSAILSIEDEILKEEEGFELVEDKPSFIGSEENTRSKQNHFSHHALFMTDESGNLIEISETSSDLESPKEENDINKIEDIMGDFYYLTSSFPQAAYLCALQRQQEITPVLLELLDQDITNYKSLEENYTGHLYALFLLAKFREKQAIPLIVKLFKLPDWAIYKLLKGVITVNLHNIVASICSSDLQMIQQIIENPTKNYTGRSVALRSLLTLVNEGKIERNVVVDYIKKLFNHPSFINDSMSMTALVLVAHDLYPKEMYTEIEEAFRRKVVNKPMELKKINDVLKMGQSAAMKKYFVEQYNFITDEDLHIIGLLDYLEQKQDEEFECEDCKLERQHATKGTHVPYRHSLPKVGRNDPCPCGSGKKFKKCCEVLH